MNPLLGMWLTNIFSQVAFHSLNKIFQREKGFDADKVTIFKYSEACFWCDV